MSYTTTYSLGKLTYNAKYFPVGGFNIEHDSNNRIL